MRNIGHPEVIADKDPYKKISEYSVPFHLDNHKVRIFWSLSNDRHEVNDKLFGQCIVFVVEGKPDLRIIMVSILTYMVGHCLPQSLQANPHTSFVYLYLMRLCKTNDKRIFSSLLKYPDVIAACCSSYTL